MIFHENRLPADGFYEISNLNYFFPKLGKISQNLSSAAVMPGALRVKGVIYMHYARCFLVSCCLYS